MKYKQLLTIKTHLITLKKSFEYSNENEVDYLSYGIISYMLFQINNLLQVYQEISYYVNKYYYKKVVESEEFDEFIEENVDLKNLMLTFTDKAQSFNILYLKNELPKPLSEFMKNFYDEKNKYDKNVSNIFNKLPKFKIVDGNPVILSKEEIIDLEIKNNFYYFDIMNDTYNWGDFYETFITLINNEKYDDIVELLGLDIL